MLRTNFLSLMKNWWWFIALTVVCLTTAAFVLIRDMPVSYKASVKLFVTSSNSTALANVSDAPYSDRAVKTVTFLASSGEVGVDVAKSLKFPATDLSKVVKIKGVTGTQLIEIQAINRDPQKAVAIANQYGQSLITYLEELQSDIDPKNQIKVSVAEEAASAQTSGPTKWQVLLFSIIASLIISYLIVYIIEFTDDTVREERDLTALNVNHLGDFVAIKDSDKEPLVNLEGNETVLEKLREIRTNITFLDKKKSKQAFVVSSAKPKEGKTLLAANLAVLIAETGKKVILVDADIRAPYVHKLFKIENKEGLTDYLANNASIKLNVTGFNNLFILTSGKNAKNATELLDLEKLEVLKQQLFETFKADFVIFDTPPLGLITDAAVISQICDGVILAVEKGSTHSKDVIKIKRSLSLVKSQILGAVLTKVREEQNSYYYSRT